MEGHKLCMSHLLRIIATQNNGCGASLTMFYVSGQSDYRERFGTYAGTGKYVKHLGFHFLIIVKHAKYLCRINFLFKLESLVNSLGIPKH